MKTTTKLLTHWQYFALGIGFSCFGAGTAQAQTRFTNTWTGQKDTVYTKPGNWSLQRVPTALDNVIIPANQTPVSILVTNQDGSQSTSTVQVIWQPSLSAALGIGTAGDLTINQGAFLRLNPQSELDLFGNLTNNGRFAGAGALVTKSPNPLPAGASHTIGGSGSAIVINDLVVDTSEPATLNIPVRLNRLLSLTGNLMTTSVGTLTLLSTPTVTAFSVPAAPTTPAGTVVENLNGVVIGAVTVQRAIDGSQNPGLGYRHFSSPVSNTTVGDFTTNGFVPVLNTAYNSSATPPATVPFPTVYGYDQALVNRVNTSPNFDKGFFSPASLNDPLVPGRGYTVNLNALQLVDFVGTLNNGDITVLMARNASNTLNSSDAGWQLLGNPYPAPLDYSRVQPEDRLGLDNTIWIYSSTGQYTGMYRSYNVGNGIGNPVLPVGQAFFARLSQPATQSVFRFRNSQRLTTSDGTTFQRTAPDTRPQLEFTLSGREVPLKDYLNVYFENGSTAGVDAKYDAVKLWNTTGLNLNTLTADGQALSIDGRPVPVGALTVPLQVAVPTSGAYTLHLEKALNTQGMHTYLRDIAQNALTDLSQQASYAFTMRADNPTPRFELVFSPTPLDVIAPAALAQQVSLYPNPAKTKAFLELPADLGRQTITATVVDGLGRTIRTAKLPAQGGEAHELSLEGLVSGIYALRLHTAAGVVAKRLVIE